MSKVLDKLFSSECVTKISRLKFLPSALSCFVEPGEYSLIRSSSWRIAFHPVNGAQSPCSEQARSTSHHFWRPSLQFGVSLWPYKFCSYPPLLGSQNSGLSFSFLCTDSLIRRNLTPTFTPHIQCVKASPTKIKLKSAKFVNHFFGIFAQIYYILTMW